MIGTAYRTHPAAEIFPMMGERDLCSLADDIAANGLREPIELLEGLLIDGRNRLAACELAGVEPRTRQLSGIESPAAYVLSKNLHRRHLTLDQRAIVGATVKPIFEAEAKERQIALAGTRPNAAAAPDLGARMPQGPPAPRAPRSRDHAGQQVGVSGRTVDKASELLAKAPELAGKVMAGEQTLASAINSVRRQEREEARAALPPPPEIAERIEVANVAEHIPLEDDSVDLIVTSPPYALDVAYDGGDIAASDWPEFMADWLAEAYRVAKTNGGRLALNTPLDTSEPTERPVYHEMLAAALGAGWIYRASIVWNKGHTTKGNRGLGSCDSASAPHPIAQVDMIALFSKGSWKKPEPGVSDITREDWQVFGNGLWDFPGESHAWEDHPAAFPKELPRRLIQYLTYVGDVVCDPFLGSGTSVLVAKELKRHGIGFDQSERYVASAKRRLHAAIEAQQ